MLNALRVKHVKHGARLIKRDERESCMHDKIKAKIYDATAAIT